MPEKMRLLGRATALDRSADQSERTMMQRQRHQGANPRADYATNFYSDPEPEATDPDLADAAAVAAVAEAVAACRTALDRNESSAPAAAPAPKPQAEPQPLPINRPAQPPATTPATATAPAAPAIAPTAATQASAIRYDGREPVTAQARPLPRKQELLRHTAMHRVVDQIGPINPGQSQPGSFSAGQATHRRPEPPANHTATP
jgi:hypothetical protein